MLARKNPCGIRIVRNGALEPEPFLDIADRVGAGGLEQGLLSVAFHPRFPADDRLFANYTDRDGDTRVSAFRLSATNPDRADPDSEVVLLGVDQPYGNHNGGQLQFGPDGYLYIGTGDGGSANDPLNAGQDRTTLLGKLLRIDVDSVPDGYAIPATNPYAGEPGTRGEIWAWGLRNPWRFGFDRLTGDLYIADVGQGDWEEVNMQPAASSGGENYGWRVMEGTHCFETDACDRDAFVPPVFEYDHDQGCSVTGGYVYRGAEHPSLRGNYFLADYCRGTVWRLFRTPSGTWSPAVVLAFDGRVSSFGEDARGELYLLDFALGGVWQVATAGP